MKPSGRHRYTPTLRAPLCRSAAMTEDNKKLGQRRIELCTTMAKSFWRANIRIRRIRTQVRLFERVFLHRLHRLHRLLACCRSLASHVV